MDYSSPAPTKPGTVDSLAKLPEDGIRELAALLCLRPDQIEDHPSPHHRRHRHSRSGSSKTLSASQTTISSAGPSTLTPSSSGTSTTTTVRCHGEYIRPSRAWLAAQARALEDPGPDENDEDDEDDDDCQSVTSGNSSLYLRRPRGLKGLRVSIAETARLLQGYQAVVLCAAHREINRRLVRDVFVALHLEATVRADAVRAHYDERGALGYRGARDSVGSYDAEWHGVASRDVCDWGDRLLGLAGLWLEPRVFERLVGWGFSAEWRCGRVRSGCLACMVAAVGGRRDALVDLRAGMLARDVAVRQRLMPLVEAWLDEYGNSSGGNRREDVKLARLESEALAEEIRAVREYQKQFGQGDGGGPWVQTRTPEGFRIPMARRGRRRKGGVGVQGERSHGVGAGLARDHTEAQVEGQREEYRAAEGAHPEQQDNDAAQTPTQMHSATPNRRDARVLNWCTAQSQDDDDEYEEEEPVQYVTEDVAGRAAIFSELEQEIERQEQEYEAASHHDNAIPSPAFDMTAVPMPLKTNKRGTSSSTSPPSRAGSSTTRSRTDSWTSAVTPTITSDGEPTVCDVHHHHHHHQQHHSERRPTVSSIYSNDWPAMPHAPPAPSTVLESIPESPPPPHTPRAAGATTPTTPRAPRAPRSSNSRFFEKYLVGEVSEPPSPTPLRRENLARQQEAAAHVAEGEWDRSTVLPEDSISCVVDRLAAKQRKSKSKRASSGRR